MIGQTRVEVRKWARCKLLSQVLHRTTSSLFMFNITNVFEERLFESLLLTSTIRCIKATKPQQVSHSTSEWPRGETLLSLNVIGQYVVSLKHTKALRSFLY